MKDKSFILFKFFHRKVLNQTYIISHVKSNSVGSKVANVKGLGEGRRELTAG